MGQSVGEGLERSKAVIVARAQMWGREFELGRGQIMQGFKSYIKDLVHYTN